MCHSQSDTTKYKITATAMGCSTQCAVTTERGGLRREVGAGFRRAGTHVCLWLIPIDVWQKPTQIS